MALSHEALTKQPGFRPGDIKLATYSITFTANQLIEPAQDPGWFLLNGAVLSQSAYPNLYARFGTTFNTGGEGTGNFRLPDHTDGKFPVAKGLAAFTVYGATGGEVTHQLSTAELSPHTHPHGITATASSHGHPISGNAPNAGNHTHGYNDVPQTQDLEFGGGTTVATGTSESATNGPDNYSHTHSWSATINPWTESGSVIGSVGFSGNDVAHNNMQPYVVFGGLLVRHV